MRMTSINSAFFKNPYISMGNYQPRTARAMAKQMVKDLGLTEVKGRENAKKGISKIDERLSKFNPYVGVGKYNDFFRNNKNIGNVEENQKLSTLLSGSEKLMLGGKNSLFNEVGIKSSDSNVADFKLKQKVTSQNRGFSLQVDALANAQSSVFSRINAADNASDNTTLTLKTKDNSQTFEVGFKNKMTGNVKSNLDVLNEMSDKINNSNMDIKAVVEKNDDGTALLRLTAQKTGAKSAFDISDLKGVLKDVKTDVEAQDAKYTIIDKNTSRKYTSDKNDISIGYNAVDAKLKNKGETKVSFDGLNKDKVKNGIKDLVENFNKVSDIFQSKNDNYSRLNNIKNMKKELSKVGLEYENNKLKIDEKSMNEALEKNPSDIERVIGGSRGLANEINKLSYSKLSSPSSNSSNSFNSRNFTDDFSYGRVNSFNNRYGYSNRNNFLNNMPMIPRNNLYGFNSMFSVGSLLNYGFFR